MSERAPPPDVGEHVGGFVVERFLKRGGMGALYVARDAHTGESVALKVLDLEGPSQSARFERECRIAERLHHPHIVAGRGYGRTSQGTPWFAMELLDGEDLETRLRRGRLEAADAVALAAQVCEALRYAHQRGVVHRDVKPANIFLLRGPSLRVKVLDFGVARLADAPTLTGTDVPVGTPSYMAPEQARGDRGVDARCDVWSLGVVLYECVAGRRPFVAETLVGVLVQILEATPPRLDAPPLGAPSRLADIVQQAMEKQRERRTPNAAAMLAALRACVVEAPITREARRDEDPSTVVDDDTEVRLVSVVLLHGVRDFGLVRSHANDLGGRVERVAGDRVVVLFGLDRWSGDEMLRAARLARASLPAAAAISVATGRVLRGASRVLGSAIDKAARAIATAGIVLDAATAEAVRGELEVSRSADGAYTLTAERSDVASSSPSFHSPFVGREVEVGLLLRSVEQSWDESRPAGVAVLGPAGIGKSRLRHEATALLAARLPHATCVVVRCDHARQNAPFAALRDAFARANAPMLDGAFDVPLGGDATTAVDRVRASLGAALQELAERGPAVWILDDAQWLDGASHAAIRWLRDALPDIAFTVWAFGRPETRDALALTGAAAVLDLGPLDARASTLLLKGIAGAAPEAMLERAGGHPLFLEELAALAARRAPDASHEELTLPVTVEGAYLAQLDQMFPAEREFLKRAAVYGRTFWIEGVEALGGDSETVARLRGARLLVPRARSRLDGAREVHFRVGVLQEVAYRLLPDGVRARLHGQAARWLSARRGAAPDELARHWERADEAELAAEHYALAAESAARLADTASACAHADRALGLSRDPTIRWRALIARDDAMQLTDRITAISEGLDAIDAIAAELGLRAQTEAAWRRCYFARVTYDRPGALLAGQRALELADTLDDPRWQTLVNIDLAMVRAMDGALDLARRHAELAREFAAHIDEEWLAARAAATLAFVQSEAGAVAEGLALYEIAAEGFARAGDKRREALMRSNAGWALLRLGRIDEAEAQMVTAIEASRRVGNEVTVASCTHNLGTLRRMGGELDEAAALQQDAAAIAARRRNTRLVCATLVERAYLALSTAGRLGSASEFAREALMLAETARAPLQLASARAVALRAEGEGCGSPESLDAARELCATLTDAEVRAELRIAIWVAGGRTSDDTDAARASLRALVPQGDDEEARRRCLGALVRRYLVPAELTIE